MIYTLRGGVNLIGGSSVDYIKQAFISLKSAALSNPNCQRMLVTNIELPSYFASLFKDNGILISIVPFEKFIMPSDFRWRNAFYKLNVLDWIVNSTDYDSYLGLDTDTYVAGNLDDLWAECKFNLPILYPLSKGFSTEDRTLMMRDYKFLFDKDELIIQYGGEFIAGSKLALQQLVASMNSIYNKVAECNFDINIKSGDEAFLSMAALDLKVSSALPYIFRFWTRRAYYNCDYNWANIPIWHLPAEKNYGLLLIFDRLTKRSNINKSWLASIFNFPNANKYSFSMLKYYIFTFFRRLKG